jgi:surface protein
MFYGCTSFTSDLSQWNVANATNLSMMFHGCVLFNSDVSRWDVAAAIARLYGMFQGCGSFQREHLATWLLPDEERLFIRSDHNWWSPDDSSEDEDETDDE